jgi:peptidoglycan/xylan/chitin deacetylase (PgdA/CDA1 family)
MISVLQAKSVLADVLDFIGVTDIVVAKKSKSRLLILMYHRIFPAKEGGPGVQAGMYVEPETFEMHLRCLKKYFQVLPLCEIRAYGNHVKNKSGERPACILTFDDGWHDFYEYAYPVLMKHEVPATVFLPTKFIGTTDSFWTDSLIRLCYGREKGGGIRRKREITSNPVIDLMESPGRDLEDRLERCIKEMKARPQEEISRILADLSDRWGVDLPSRERNFLAWDEVREMYRSGLVSFGSHTESHRILTTLRDGEIDEELQRSKNRLLTEGVVNPSFIPFAYPDGGYDRNIRGMVERHGYSVAVTTRKSWVRCHEKGSEFELGRIGIHQDVASTESLFRCRILQIV